MGTSPDVGGRMGLGRPLVLQHDELEASAQTQVAKQGLGIVPNTIEVVFTQLGGNVWHYDANASKPHLPMNVLVGFIRSETKSPPSLEKKIFEKLMGELPLSLSLELKREKKKPLSQQDPTFLVLEQILQFLAKAEAYLIGIADENSTISEERRSLVIQFPNFALQEWIFSAQEVLDEMTSLLSNNLELSTKFKESQGYLAPLVKRVEGILKETNLKKKAQSLAALVETTLQIEQLQKEKKVPNLLHLVGKLISSLLSICNAMQYSEAAPAFLHLIYGADIFESQTIGAFSILQKCIDAFPDLSLPQRKLLSHIAYVSMLSYNILVSEAAGIAYEAPFKGIETTERIRSLAFALASTLISQSKAIPIISQSCLHAMFRNSTLEKSILEMIQVFTLTLPILAGSKGDKAVETMDAPFLGTKELILDSLQALKTTIESFKNKALAIAHRQAILAIEEQDVPEYVKAAEQALKLLQMTLQSSQYESEQMVGLSVNLLSLLYSSKEQENVTNVIRQAA